MTRTRMTAAFAAVALGMACLAAGAAPAKKAAPKKPAARKPAAQKPPASQGGATQLTAIEGEVGKEYVNRAFRLTFGLPKAQLAYGNSGADEGQYWLVFPISFSNATKGELDFYVNDADLADAAAKVLKVDHQSSSQPLLPAAHGKGEIAFKVPYSFKPAKTVVQLSEGLPLRLMLPKSFVLTPPRPEGKLGAAVSNGLASLTITAPRPAAKYGDEEAEEDKSWLLVDAELVSEVTERQDWYLDPVSLGDANGDLVSAHSVPNSKDLAPGGKIKFTFGFQVEKGFKPAAFVLQTNQPGSVPITIKLP